MLQKIILLADDDIDDTEMFREALTSIDDSIICHCAANGSEVLEKLNELKNMPDVIFLDLNMPIMDGWKCLQHLKDDEHYKHIPVIMISTSSHKQDMDMASSLGALCYFVKPNSFNDLIQILKSITENLGSGLSDAVRELQGNGSKLIFSCSDNS